MNTTAATPSWWIAIPLGCLALSLVVSIQTVQTTRTRTATIQRLQQDLQALQTLEAERNQLIQARERYQQQGPGLTLPALLRSLQPDPTMQIDLRDASGLADGWFQRNYEVTFDAISIRDLPSVIQQIQTSARPRKIKEIQILPAGNRTEARCSLLIEAIEPADQEPAS